MLATIEDQQDLQQLFDGIGESFIDTRYADWGAQEITHLESVHASYFQQGAGPDGVPWAPLKPSTIKKKGHGVILIDGDDLETSLTRPGAGIREVVDEPAGVGVGFGSDVEYSIYHDTDTAHRPARRHVGINDEHVTGSAERALDVTVESIKQDA